LFGLRQLREVSCVDKESGRRWHRVDAIESNFEGRSHIFICFLTETDVTIADLEKAEVGSRQRLSGLCDLGKSSRREDSAADRPKQAGTCPCHAVEKAAAINSVVLVV